MPSSVSNHLVPRFYACYLLRSTVSPHSTYVGSTPHPPRRKRQHNGELKQGAWRTTKSRPWEMECIVYGFQSKLGALQFEWAWAKPHLSRHLKSLPDPEPAPSVTTNRTTTATKASSGLSNQRPPSPLFPAVSCTKPAGRKRPRSRPQTSPTSRLLVLRALIRSEPFSGWNLKLAFFSEWAYAAWIHLDRTASNDNDNHDHDKTGSNLSRTGRRMSVGVPELVCDFSGVDGKRSRIPSDHLQGPSVCPTLKRPAKTRNEAHPLSPPSSSSNRGRCERSGESDRAPLWHETLPKPASSRLKGVEWDASCARSMGLTLQDLESHPRTPEGVPPVGRKRMLTRKATNVRPEDRARMRFHDEDLMELQWQRWLSFLASRRVGLQVDDLVRHHLNESESPKGISTTSKCGICKNDIDLGDHLSYSLCPSAYTRLKPARGERGGVTSETSSEEDHHCHSIYHLACLAESFLDKADAQDHGGRSAEAPRASILPTHGACPSTYCRREGEWTDVIRSMYRRKERFEEEVELYLKMKGKLAREREKSEQRESEKLKSKEERERKKLAREMEKIRKREEREMKKVERMENRAKDAGGGEVPRKKAVKATAKSKLVTGTDVPSLREEEEKEEEVSRLTQIEIHGGEDAARKELWKECSSERLDPTGEAQQDQKDTLGIAAADRPRKKRIMASGLRLPEKRKPLDFGRAAKLAEGENNEQTRSDAKRFAEVIDLT
ncbi:hypothetical protein IE53DRAFT_346674 [Violaceomyces palustris]|uniref:Uncharacterized protein n=1 Tax=Violaceomyces palustris TaxID=1673888 RepID=A0ACD0NT79_9BASI|nr:hypothetical protein IE53DRAFT_346674 [Violaceomyces palustris]